MNHITESETDAFAFVRIRGNKRVYSPVKNSYYTLMLGVEGQMEVQAGYHRFILPPRHIAVISPDLIFSIDHTTADLQVCQLRFKKEFLYKTHIKEQIIDELLYLHPEYPPVYPIEENTLDTLQMKFNTIEEEQHRHAPFCLNIIRLILIELLYDFNRACEYCLLNFKKEMNRQYQLAFQFKKLVDTGFIHLRTVTEYAALLGVTAKHLSETVKEETGKTALEVIHERLLLEIQYQLKHSSLSIKEIADYFRFDNASHFSRFFKSKTGITPLAYRRFP